MLPTNLQHIESDEEFRKVLDENDNVMVVCGRAGPMCLPVYDVMDNVKDDYQDVTFRDMDFDSPVATNIRKLEEVRGFMSLPFVVYFKNGKVVEAKSSTQNRDQVVDSLERNFRN